MAGISWILGIRAIRVAHRTRSPIDWALAVVTLAAGGFGCPLTFLPSLLDLDAELRARVLAGGMIGLGAASGAIYLAIWRYFRPDSVIAALICTAGSFVIAWSILAEMLTSGFAWGRDRRWLTLGGVASWLPYAWGAIEMVLEARRLRAAGGSGAAQAARGFVLYGLALGSVAVVYVPGLVSAFRNPGGEHPPIVVGFVAAAGFVAAGSAAIGFYRASRVRSSS